MLRKVIRLIIIVALIALAVSIWPEVYEWIRKGIDWLLSQGKWGLIVIAALRSRELSPIYFDITTF